MSQKCPQCGAEEIDAMTPRTVYACGSSDYDQRPGTFKRGYQCRPPATAKGRQMLGLGPAPTCTPTVFPFPPFWFIFDVESIGLHGEAFAVAAQVFDHQAQPLPLEGGWWHSSDPNLSRGTMRNHEWVYSNVPEMTHADPKKTRREIRDFFWDSWQEAKQRHPGIVMAAECAWPVEARFLIECIEDAPETREFAGPYPLHDIASIMLAAGMDPMKTYERVNPEYPPHHPLGDVQHSAHCLAMALEKLRITSACAQRE